MQRVECERCGVAVLVEKHSWQHTSVQWDTDRPDTVCDEYQDGSAPTSGGAGGEMLGAS
ncbi:hypothetical protein [Rhodococcus chondri]|uniref:C2H2-type domain-containing protein n=1 Tax=Rhodococcus chondri TaxID=3065941 RepID=A0ABU7JM14_9NOCA|nr:hypothetical protein [Rhodococcus sp. CC-R104]MEE2030894.1 hypothetical protein [Rhodococcus sp. CC-R104]